MNGICRTSLRHPHASTIYSTWPGCIFVLFIVTLCGAISIQGNVEDSGRIESIGSVLKSSDGKRLQLGQDNEDADLIERKNEDWEHINGDTYAYFSPKSRMSRDTSIKDKIKKKITNKVKGKHGKRRSGGPDGARPAVYIVILLGVLTISSSHISYLFR